MKLQCITFYLTMFMLLFNCSLFAQVPTINSFSPSTGPAGTKVSISGTNFNPNKILNVVYFGAAKATVTEATSTSISVIVPAGSTFQPITVTANKLTGSSIKPFIATFPDANELFSRSSYDPPIDIGLKNAICWDQRQTILNDFDGDGKIDIAVNNPNKNEVYILKNSGGVTLFNAVPTVTLSTGNLPIDLTNSDIDGDGLSDIVVINRTGNTISLFKNTSSASRLSFESKIDLNTVNSPETVHICDIDKDGKPDIVISSYTSNTVSIYKNISDGNLNFSARTDITSIPARDVVVSDANADGFPDLLVLSGLDNVSIFKNQGNGTIAFDSPIKIQVTNPRKIVAGDLDGDGMNDIAVSTSSNISMFKNTTPVGGSFSFKEQKQVYLKMIPYEFADRDKLYLNGNIQDPYNLAIGDLNGDGKPDLAITVKDSYNQIAIIKNISSAGAILFEAEAHYWSSQVHTVSIGDVDGDHKPDLVVGSREDGTVHFHKSKITEPTLTGFSTLDGLQVSIDGTNLSKTSALMLDGQPVAYKIDSETNITAAIGPNKSGSFSVSTPYGVALLKGFSNVKPPVINSFSPLSGKTGSSITITGQNFNPSTSGNKVFFGPSQAIVTSASSNSLTVTVPPGSTHQTISVTTNELTAYSKHMHITSFAGSDLKISDSSFSKKADVKVLYARPKSIAHADFNNDGNLDIIFSEHYSAYEAEVYIWQNSGNKSTPFPSSKRFRVDGKLTAVLTGDFDGDGKTDFIVANETKSNFSVFKNTTSGSMITFAPKIEFKTHDSPDYFVVEDFDGDGKPDLASVSNEYYIVSLYRNTSHNGVISFADRINYPGGGKDIVVADFDGDGKADIVTSSNFGQLNSFRNISINGAIKFEDAKITDAIGETSALATGDFNLDGKTDIATVSGSNSIAIFKNTSSAGDISFGPEIRYLTVTSGFPSRIAINDLNGDSKPDIIVSNMNRAVITIHQNTSQGPDLSFDPAIQYTTGRKPEGVISGDYNLDGKPDIAVAVYDDEGFSLFLNQQSFTSPIFTLPSDNFNVSITGLSCRDRGDGTINISAKQSLDYTATITGNGISKNIPFTTTAAIANLSAGTYDLCITLENHKSYKQCYVLKVDEPEELNVYAVVSDTGDQLNLNLSGGSNYYIILNGKQYTTTTGSYSLPLRSGINKMSVKTDKLCQGTVDRIFNVSETIQPYPNPFQSIINVDLGPMNIISLAIKLYNVSDGRLVKTEKHANKSGVLQIEATDIKPGVYTLVVSKDGVISVSKMLKL